MPNLFYLKAVLNNIITAIMEAAQGERPPYVMSPREILYNTALAACGTDASSSDLALDEYGCAESVNEIHKTVFGDYIVPQPKEGEPLREEHNHLSTYWLYKAIKKRLDFAEVNDPEPGDIVISPTGYGKGSGHVGILGPNATIMSNNSFRDANGEKGIFDFNYTIDSWRRRFVDRAHLPMRFFRKI